MKKYGYIQVILSLVIALFTNLTVSNAQDKLIGILEEELQREFQILKKQETPAYYINYRVEEHKGYSISGNFGSTTYSNDSKYRYLTVCVRVGDKSLDNYHPLRGGSESYRNYTITELPSFDDPTAVKQALWNATNEAYQQAVADYAKVKANVAVKVDEEDKSPDFTIEKPNVYIEPIVKFEDIKFDKTSWEARMKKYSAAFLKDSAIFSGSSYMGLQVVRKYFVSSEGDKIAQNALIARAGFNGTIKAKDGMELPLGKYYYATKPENLPSDKEMTNDINKLVSNLISLKNAPVAEPYSGPALLSGKAGGVFFHEIFGHRIEGQRMKNESDAQTFKKKLNEKVLPEYLSVYSDPLMREFDGQELNGFYLYDDQGSKGEKVNVVENGILKNFLMSRTPIENFPRSNGHGRAMYGLQPASRQSNLIIDASQTKSKEELREELIRLAKEQGKPYGYFFDEVVGGFTQTGRFMPNAFNVTPTLVYRVYTDGRPDEIVRGVDLIGTPLSMFSQIGLAGKEKDIFNGYCGAESGSVPVSAVCPMLLVKVIETQKKAKSQERSIILPRPDGEK
jgi:TldD protein